MPKLAIFLKIPPEISLIRAKPYQYQTFTLLAHLEGKQSLKYQIRLHLCIFLVAEAYKSMQNWWPYWIWSCDLICIPYSAYYRRHP